jgi:Ca2+-binding RTX toxin-like protein
MGNRHDGQDSVWGDDGHDTMSYTRRSSGVRVDLVNGTAFGYEAENDVVDSLEEIVGGSAKDHLQGSDRQPWTLRGGPGPDKIIGKSTAQTDEGDRLLGEGDGDAIQGGDASDHIDGGGGDDTLDGGLGDDRLLDSDGTDHVLGGQGADTFVAGPGADVYDGGFGSADTVSYAGRRTPVSLTLDGVANDGEMAGSIYSAEDFRWPSIVVLPPPQLTLIGRGGRDRITGGPYDDVIYGDQPEWETPVTVTASQDLLNGGPGNDHLHGGPGADTLVGSNGDDVLDAVDGAGGDDVFGSERDADVPDDQIIDTCTGELGDRFVGCP